MIRSIVTLMNPDEWRRGIAIIILWAYGYQLIVWPIWFNLAVIFSAIFGVNIPAPIIVPWEQLLAGTTTLATVGGIQAWRDKLSGDSDKG